MAGGETVKLLFMFLCSLFILTCVVIHEAKAEQSSLEAQLEKNYKSLIRQQTSDREEAGKKWQEQEKIRKNVEAEQAVIEAQNEADEEARQKQCGNDYKNLRVGMTLDRVQKCVAEFFLRGQVKTKNGVVDHYTRGDSYIYVKKGRVVAWGG